MKSLNRALTSGAAALALTMTLALPPVQAQEPTLSELEQMESFLGLMQRFFGIIDSMYEISRDPEKAAIFQLHKIQEAYEEGGEKHRAGAVMRQVLEDTNNETIRTATYLMLGDLLKESGRRDQAIEVLRRGLDESLRNAP